MDTEQEENSKETLSKQQEAERLRAFIDKKTNLTDKELAKVLGVSPKQLCQYTKSDGKTINSAPRAVLYKLREQFELDLNWLITGKSADLDYVSIPLCEWEKSEYGYQTRLTETKLISIPAISLKDYRPEKLKAAFIEGDELSTLGIDIGDLVVFYPFKANSEKKDGTYIIERESLKGMQGTIKEVTACYFVFTHDRKVSLQWNKDRKAGSLRDDSERIIGRVVACIHTYRRKPD